MASTTNKYECDDINKYLAIWVIYGYGKNAFTKEIK